MRPLTWRWTFRSPSSSAWPGIPPRVSRFVTPLSSIESYGHRPVSRITTVVLSSAFPYRGIPPPACLRDFRRWGNVPLGHPVAHHSEGRQSRLTPYDAGLALRQSNARSISLIQCQNCKVLLKELQKLQKLSLNKRQFSLFLIYPSYRIIYYIKYIIYNLN